MIDLILASRGRPKRLAELLDSAFTMAALPDKVRASIRLDEDDAFLTEYQALTPSKLWRAAYIVGKKEFVPKLIAEMAQLSISEIQGHVADDVIFRTRGWDARIRAELRRFRDGMGVVYTNDGLGRRKCQHFFCTKKWMQAVGTEGWSELRHFGLDQWHEEIAQSVGRLVYLDDIVLEHMHMKHRDAQGRPKGEKDDTYTSKRIENWSGADAVTFQSLAGVRAQQLARVRQAMC